MIKILQLIDHIYVCNKEKYHIAGLIINSTVEHFPTIFIEDCNNRIINKWQRFIRLIWEYSGDSYWTNVMEEEYPEIAYNICLILFKDARDMAFPEVIINQTKNEPWLTKGLLFPVSQKVN